MKFEDIKDEDSITNLRNNKKTLSVKDSNGNSHAISGMKRYHALVFNDAINERIAKLKHFRNVKNGRKLLLQNIESKLNSSNLKRANYNLDKFMNNFNFKNLKNANDRLNRISKYMEIMNIYCQMKGESLDDAFNNLNELIKDNRKTNDSSNSSDSDK